MGAAFPGTAADLRAIELAISPARLKTYLRRSHFNLRRALALYEWNIQASADLYPILQLNEIALRNAIDVALTAAYGRDWHLSGGFLRSLPSPERASFDAELRKLAAKHRVKGFSTGDVIAAQTYWFWVLMLTQRYQARIWNRGFALAFPHAPPRVGRATVHQRSDAIRRLRNRIAHHEPLLGYDLRGVYLRAISTVRWISPVMAEWASHRWPAPASLSLRS